MFDCDDNNSEVTIDDDQDELINYALQNFDVIGRASSKLILEFSGREKFASMLVNLIDEGGSEGYENFVNSIDPENDRAELGADRSDDNIAE